MESTAGSLPERPDEPDCGYYMRTGLCGFGPTCRFNHPPDRRMAINQVEYPERIGQPECQYYLKTATCKFGLTCKYHHPRDKAGIARAVPLNVLGYPLRVNEKECAFYLRNGQCKYGIACKFHHPEPVDTLVSVPMSPLYLLAPSPAATAHQQYPGVLPTWTIGQVGPIASPDNQKQVTGTGLFYGPTYQTDPCGIQGGVNLYPSEFSAMGFPVLQVPSSGPQIENMFPERPGQPECQFYMKTGDCKFGMKCRYHHPKDVLLPTANSMLNTIGLPLHPGAPTCIFYMHYGICKYGPNCKFNHPMRTLSYSPSASSLGDMPVAPLPVVEYPSATVAPSSKLSTENGTVSSPQNISTSKAQPSGGEDLATEPQGNSSSSKATMQA